MTDPLDRKTQFGYDSDGQLLWTQDAKHAAFIGGAPRDYRTYFDYDSFHRMGRQSAPKSTDTERGLLIWSGADFDANDNTVLDIDQHYGQQYSPGVAFQVKHAFDVMDRETLATAMDTSADAAGERTSTAYDPAGRKTRQIRPLGVQSTTIANDHTVDFSYDLLDRTVRVAAYEVDTAGVQKSVKYTHTCFDLAGDAVRTIAPRANRATVSCTDDTVPFLTKTTYDAAHRPLTRTDPAGRVRRTAYDANDNVISRTDQDGKGRDHRLRPARPSGQEHAALHRRPHPAGADDPVGVRGNPDHAYPTQQVDHVRVNHRGKVIGRDGKSMASVKADHNMSHIPKAEYENWTSWYQP